ncbi:MAG: RagB/SusD family nutrient uptake outer membrane protein [Candidatus Azobacteroides sp.]|nr:RagB/SusD family nutrient uptake outer membrane protein [Candidatus Azobacteroides sp.]
MKKYILFTALITALGFLSSCAGDLYSDPLQEITEKQIIDLSRSNPEVVLGPMAGSVEIFPKTQYSTTVWCRDMRVFLVGIDFIGNDKVHLNPSETSWLANDYRMENYRTERDELPAEWWTCMYAFVYKANQFLSVIPDIETITNPDVQNTLKTYRAIGLTLRAWGYSYLMWFYQDDYLHGGSDKPGVPLYLEPNVPAAGRAPSKDVWDQIIADASEAVNLFNEGGRNPRASLSDMDATVANMILARAALTTGDWDKVIAATDAIIATYPTLMNETDYTTKGFGWMDVDEIIYGFDYDQTIGGTSSFHGWMNVLSDGGYGGSQGSRSAIDNRLYDKIHESDYRKTNFLADPMEHTYAGDDVPITLPKYTNMKFAAPAHTGQPNYVQGEIFLRTSEALLMNAEAHARKNEDAAARTALNTLLAARTKAGEMALTCDTYTSMAGLSTLEMVQLQTRIELWGEGFELINNKRWNIGVDRMDSENHSSRIVRPVQPDMTLQIPRNELLYNQYITEADQNPAQ